MEYFFGTNEPDYNNGKVSYNLRKRLFFTCFIMNNNTIVVMIKQNGDVLFTSKKSPYEIQKFIESQYSGCMDKRAISKPLSYFDICINLVKIILEKQKLQLNQLYFVCGDKILQKKFFAYLNSPKNKRVLENLGFEYSKPETKNDYKRYIFVRKN